MNDTPTTPTNEISITVDRAKLTLGDMRFIAKLNASEKGKATPETMERMFDMLERVIVGGIENIPYDALPAVMESISAALNPETEVKN